MADKQYRKYNHIESIPVSEIPEEEMDNAIRDWAQGNPGMYKVLKACYEEGIETFGSHPDEHGMYIDFRVTDEKSIEKLKNIFRYMQFVNGGVCFITEGFNPISSSEFYKSGFGIDFFSEEGVSDDFYDKLYNSIKGYEEYNFENDIYASILDFYNLLAEKGYCLLFDFKRKEEKYCLDIEMKSYDINEFLNKYFIDELGLDFDGKADYSFSSEDGKIFLEKIKEIENCIKDNFNLEYPTKIERGMSAGIVGRLKQLEFGDTDEGRINFEIWKKKFEIIAAYVHDNNIYDAFLYEDKDIFRGVFQRRIDINDEKCLEAIDELKKEICLLYNLKRYDMVSEEELEKFINDDVYPSILIEHGYKLEDKTKFEEWVNKFYALKAEHSRGKITEQDIINWENTSEKAVILEEEKKAKQGFFTRLLNKVKSIFNKKDSLPLPEKNSEPRDNMVKNTYLDSLRVSNEELRKKKKKEINKQEEKQDKENEINMD